MNDQTREIKSERRFAIFFHLFTADHRVYTYQLQISNKNVFQRPTISLPTEYQIQFDTQTHRHDECFTSLHTGAVTNEKPVNRLGNELVNY